MVFFVVLAGMRVENCNIAEIKLCGFKGRGVLIFNVK